MTDFFEFTEKTYIEQGFAPEVNIGFERLTVSEIFSHSVCLPLLAMIINSYSMQRSGLKVLNQDCAFERSTNSTFGIKSTPTVFKPSMVVPVSLMKDSVNLLGRLICHGVNQLTWVTLMANYLENIHRDEPMEDMYDENFISYVEKLIQSKHSQYSYQSH